MKQELKEEFPEAYALVESFENKVNSLQKSVDFGYEGDQAPTEFIVGDINGGFHLQFEMDGDNEILAVAAFSLAQDETLEWDFWLDRDIKWKIFELLEGLIWTLYQEYQNNDPADFEYSYDSDHLGERATFKVRCTDYFS